MPPLMDLHKISMDFAGQGGTPELAGGRGDAGSGDQVILHLAP